MPSATGSSPGRPGSSHRASEPAPSAVTPCCASTPPSSPTKWCRTSSAASIAAPCQQHGPPGRRPMTCASRSASDRMSSQGTRPAFQRVAIINRGEPAMRLINAVREWNAEGRRALRVIALYTAADRRAMFVRAADEAVLIGPADPVGDGAAFDASPYLDYAGLERALRECRADAAWPGWGFVSEKAEFAELCGRLGITFIGPPADVMRRLGDKIESKRLAGQVGVPLAAWSGGAVADLEQARAQAKTIGYPLMVKATAGGGGQGIQLVRSPAELAGAFDRARSEASKTAGDATVFLQRATTQPEGDRGVFLDCAGCRAGAHAAFQCRQADPGGRLRQRRDCGVPLRTQGAAAVVPGS